MSRSALLSLLGKHPKPVDHVFSYGTAGFREKAAILDSVFVRMGVLAWMRAVEKGAAIGLMVTASHNQVADNGIKLVDPDGGMLDPTWEGHAAALANAPTPEAALSAIENIAKTVNINIGLDESVSIVQIKDTAKVFVARDTRPHSSKLSKLVLAAVSCLGGTVHDFGVLTTPQLHFCVQHQNSNNPEDQKLANEEGYYSKLVASYQQLVGEHFKRYDPNEPSKLIIDAGFGVGGEKFKRLVNKLNETHVYVDVSVRNSATAEEMLNESVASKLNNGVGAEHVQKQQELPKDTVDTMNDRMVRFASFDGDADRIVYFYINEQGEMVLLDGDKIASLLAGFIKQHFDLLPTDLKTKFTIGAVQTAYANGASMNYLKRDMNLEVPLAKTGVKYLHHIAVKFDVGIYFEANGHGTVLFKPSLVSTLENAATSEGLTDMESLAIKRILALSKLINQATGDAMADALAVEAILHIEKMSISDWSKIYTDLPSRQLKVKVKDRTAIKTIQDESKTTAPADLQPKIDEIVSDYENGRAFVRPSGTEDVVRIYAEATTQELADELALKICQAAYDMAGGVGDRP
mmetsp:Transcript_1580/g.2037  ORF Transcript_1580/g.2037 Transcript_1580/m.2037 type:complete len:576 (-) Transcript_1580:274-2001(-)